MYKPMKIYDTGSMFPKTWISNVILCHGIFLMFNELGRELIVHFVDIGGILTITV
jgi:hypothetical protein